MKPSFHIQKPASPLRITLIVLLITSLLYPFFFAYIDERYDPFTLATELLLTAARLTGIALLSYAIIQLTQKPGQGFRPAWLRHLAEMIVLLFAAYWFLVFFLKFIDQPLTGGIPADPAQWEFRRYIGLYLLGTVFIYIFLSGLHIYQQAQQKAAQAAQMQREFAQVRLQALKSQVNPHFLFNSLSVLSSLVHAHAELSEKFIVHLSKAYRYILEQKDLELTTLKEELNFLDAYFFLLQIRFEQKVQLQKEILLPADDYALPPLTLQLLLENAVKHNKMSAASPLVIALRTEGENLVVENNVSKREQTGNSTGIGLENIKKRYALLTHKKVSIKQTEKTFRVTVPLLKSFA